MKNLFKKKHTNENTYKTYIDSALEEKILKIIHSSKAEIINLAPHYKDREFTKSDCQEVFSLADRKFQNIHSTINLHSQAEYREGLINSEVENSERIVLGFNREREDLKKEKLILEREKTAFQPSFDFSKLKWYYLVLALLYTGEVALIATAFYKVFGESLLFVLIASLSLSTGLFFTNDFVAKKIRTIAKKKIWVWIVSAAYLLFFFGLAAIRSMALNKPIISWETVSFMGISIILTIASMLISTYKLPSDEERLKNKKYKEYSKKIAQAEQKIENINIEEKLQPQKSREEILTHISVMSFAKHLREIVDSECESTKNEFLSTVKLYTK